jgi:hypothetical protein
VDPGLARGMAIDQHTFITGASGFVQPGPEQDLA